MISQFKEFLTTTNAMALAIGVIIGAAAGKLVSAVVDDVLMPLVGLILPAGDWREAQIVMKQTTDAVGKVSVTAIKYGHLIGTVLDFVIISYVVFLIAKALIREKPSDPTKTCPECLEAIPAGAARCKYCTAAQPATA